MKTTMSLLAATAIAGLASIGLTQTARADDKNDYYKPRHKAVFVDKPEYKNDFCSFDKYPGSNVYFETKYVEIYGYKYTVLIGNCKIPLGYKPYKDKVTRNFECKYIDKNKYDDLDNVNEHAFYSKYRVKAYDPYAYLTCKWLVDKDDEDEHGNPKD